MRTTIFKVKSSMHQMFDKFTPGTVANISLKFF